MSEENVVLKDFDSIGRLKYFSSSSVRQNVDWWSFSERHMLLAIDHQLSNFPWSPVKIPAAVICSEIIPLQLSNHHDQKQWIVHESIVSDTHFPTVSFELWTKKPCSDAELGEGHVLRLISHLSHDTPRSQDALNQLHQECLQIFSKYPHNSRSSSTSSPVENEKKRPSMKRAVSSQGRLGNQLKPTDIANRMGRERPKVKDTVTVTVVSSSKEHLLSDRDTASAD